MKHYGFSCERSPLVALIRFEDKGGRSGRCEGRGERGEERDDYGS